jgi:hypothetical protein
MAKRGPAAGRAKTGGARSGAGGTVSEIHISKEHAKTLRSLLKLQASGKYSREEVARWVESQIDAAWAEYDAEISEAIETAWEGEIL